MNTITITRIRFRSFVKLTMAMFFALGCVIGLLFLLLGLTGGDVFVELGSTRFEGPLAGFLGLVLAPVFFGLFGGLCGLFSYRPFTLLLNIITGLTLQTNTRDHITSPTEDKE